MDNGEYQRVEARRVVPHDARCDDVRPARSPRLTGCLTLVLLGAAAVIGVMLVSVVAVIATCAAGLAALGAAVSGVFRRR